MRTIFFYQFNLTKIIEVKTGTSILAKITNFFNNYDDLTKDTIYFILFGQKANRARKIFGWYKISKN
ncbi:hypothetical protein D6D54_01920 [Spiroplasma poulsonii]|uniref:Uncharacterized protein n=1 Tax=Spiroplasma poulsonii TaxID=2138 RepID=A0A3S0SFN6_9MOLU|nr:hypothetical protein [Spiroplasma poulsonii]RUP78235.1 hypothetical protein D6D54_01920 [Spiroplasma poulsonii]